MSSCARRRSSKARRHSNRARPRKAAGSDSRRTSQISWSSATASPTPSGSSAATTLSSSPLSTSSYSATPPPYCGDQQRASPAPGGRSRHRGGGASYQQGEPKRPPERLPNDGVVTGSETDGKRNPALPRRRARDASPLPHAGKSRRLVAAKRRYSSPSPVSNATVIIRPGSA